MQQYSFDNSHLPSIVRVPIHFVITSFLSVITLKVTLTTLDFFQIGIDLLQSNQDLGIMLVSLILIVSFLIFDSLLMPITDTGGLLNSLYTSIKNEYDVKVYMKREYATTVDELDYIRENFAKNFDLKSFCEFTETDRALEGILLSKQMDVIPGQVENIRTELINADLPDAVIIEPLEEVKTESLVEMETKAPDAVIIEPLEEVKTEPLVEMETDDLSVIENFDDILEGIKTVNKTPINLENFGDFGKPLEDVNVSNSPNDIAERLRLITKANEEIINAKNEVENVSEEILDKIHVKLPLKPHKSSLDHEDAFYSDLHKLKEKQDRL